MLRVWSSFSARATAICSAALALVTVSTSGCGGTGEKVMPDVTAITDGGLTVDPCNLTATLDTHEFGCTPGPGVDRLDFEGYPAGIGALPTGWFRYIDQIAPGAVFIDPHTGLTTTDMSGANDTYTRMTADDRHCGPVTDSVAYHMLAEYQDVWGPQFGAKFDNGSDGPLPPVNITDWEGIGFWAKKGNDHPELEPTGTSMFVSLRDENLISSNSDTVPPCNDRSNIDSKKCDPFGAGVGFDTTWRYVMIPFDDMKQRGYGVHEDELDKTQYFEPLFQHGYRGRCKRQLECMDRRRHPLSAQIGLALLFQQGERLRQRCSDVRRLPPNGSR